MHRQRYSEDGHARFLTFSCFHGHRMLAIDQPRQWFLEALKSARVEFGFDLWGWVIMPDHVHLLIFPRGGADIPAILHRCKKPVADRVVGWLRQADSPLLQCMLDTQPSGKIAHRFWQRGGGFDRNIYSAQEAHEKLAYIHNNPVRAGLVEQTEDWPWSSWHAWNGKLDQP